jgi:hypothetical protein
VAIAADTDTHSADTTVLINSGSFRMGSDDAWAYAADGEGPVRESLVGLSSSANAGSPVAASKSTQPTPQT